MANAKLTRVVHQILQIHAKKGQATKNGVTQLAWRKIENTGGPTKYGIGRAAMTMAMLHLISTEVTRQFKAPLTDHDAEYRLPASVRDDVKEIAGKVPAWIAIEDGTDAIWMHTLKARPEHWQANGILKEKKAIQTQKKANLSIDVALFLSSRGFNNLEEAIRSK